MTGAAEFVCAGSAAELRERGRRVVTVGRTPVLVLWHEGAFHALDNRCPHLGFPLSKGDLHDGLLDCHWHHARFDVSCGATLDPWADDVASYRVEERDDGQVWIDPRRPPRDPREHGLGRLACGLRDDLWLVIAKAVVEMQEGGVPVGVTAHAAARWGATERKDGWSSALSILSALVNVLPSLDDEDRQRALTAGAAQIADQCAGEPPRRPLDALVGSSRDAEGLTAWFREAVEVRDAAGAERVLATLVRDHGRDAALRAVLLANTDHRYTDGGHTLDFAVKCAELADALVSSGDAAHVETAALLFTSLVPQLVKMERMEETSAWRRPVDVAAIVDAAFADVAARDFGAGRPLTDGEEQALTKLLLGEAPAESAQALVTHVNDGVSPVALAEAVVLAATLRVLHFGTANETPDWDTVHHTLTYANAVAEGLRRVPDREVFRGVVDAAMSVYLDRFLNVPPAPLPVAAGDGPPRGQLLGLYDQRSAVRDAAASAWSFLERGGSPEELLATLGHAVLREDAGFHAYQQLDIAWRRLQRRGDGRAARLALTACARWLAAQFPTRRAKEQTFTIARRLHRGDTVFEA